MKLLTSTWGISRLGVTNEMVYHQVPSFQVRKATLQRVDPQSPKGT